MEKPSARRLLSTTTAGRYKNMQNSYEKRDATWSEDRRRRLPSPGHSFGLMPPKLAYGWTPTVSQGGWRDASRTPGAIFDASGSTFRFVLLCALWYTSSALSSNTGKAIMLVFKFPVTLTIVQFAFISGYCLLLSSPFIRLAKLRKPTAAILRSTIPMAAFQVGGHISSSMAISRIPVSTVHTIKALSPLFTVAAYAMLFGVKYSPTTYFSLLPLTIGVMLSCSFDMAANPFGLVCAFGSAIIFVSSNIFFKKIMPTQTAGSAPQTNRLDKINLLFYSSGLAFLMMIPIWFYYDLFPLLNYWSSGSIVAFNRHVSPGGHSIAYYFFTNGTVHFLQNMIAFAILATTSPVTYSIASLVKRIAVICIAIVWFNQSVHPVQGFGICLTFAGLWMYNGAKGDVDRGEKMVQRVEAMREMVLPSTKEEVALLNGVPEGPSYPIHSSFSAVQQRRSTSMHLPRRVPHPREYPPPIPAPLNTTLASRNYVPKYIPVFSPPLADVNPNPPAIADAYPSPPRSLDSPPLELDNLVLPIGVGNSHTTQKIWNRKGTMQHAETHHQMNAISVN